MRDIVGKPILISLNLRHGKHRELLMAHDVRQQRPSFWFQLTNDSALQIPFASNEHATMAKAIIDVDEELNPQTVTRTLTVEGEVLIATFKTLTIRLARLTVNGFLEDIELVLRTIAEFGEDAQQQHSSG